MSKIMRLAGIRSYAVVQVPQLLIMIAISLMTAMISRPAGAAEVSCAQWWGAQADETFISNWFPSGQRPASTPAGYYCSAETSKLATMINLFIS